MQTGGLVSQRCADVQWLGGLNVQQGLQYLSAWDAAVCTAVSLGHPLPVSHFQNLTILQLSSVCGVCLVALSHTEWLIWGSQGHEY